MLALLAVGFGLGVATLASPGPQRRLREAMNPAAFLGGRTAAAVNYAMAHDLPIGNGLSAAGGVLRWRLFGSGGPQVTVGCGDWLYLTEELRPWPGSDAAMDARAAALRAVAAGLARAGASPCSRGAGAGQDADRDGRPVRRALLGAVPGALRRLRRPPRRAALGGPARRLRRCAHPALLPHRHALEPGRRRHRRGRHRRRHGRADRPRPAVPYRLRRRRRTARGTCCA